jgi:hypothetical protein
MDATTVVAITVNARAVERREKESSGGYKLKALLSNLLCCCFSVATALRWLGKFLSGAAGIYRKASTSERVRDHGGAGQETGHAAGGYAA